MNKVPPTLELPSVDYPLDWEKQTVWNRHIGRALSEGSALLATRVNGLLPKNGSEAMTGSLDMGAFNISNVGTLSANLAAITTTLTVGTNLTPIGAAGSVVDSVVVTYATSANLTTILPDDDTIPTITEGVEILTITITPKSVLNKLRCRFSGFGTTAANTYTFNGALYQGSTCIDSVFLFPTIANQELQMALTADYTPGVLTAQTISVRVGPGAAGTIRMNGTTATRKGGGSAHCTLIVEEIKG